MEMLKLINSLSKFGMNSEGCLRMQLLCDRLGNPQDKLNFIHVGGTNGKGSTCHMLANILLSQGLKVGEYISPSLYKFNERISVNNQMISDEEIEKYYPMFSNVLESFEGEALGYPTEFEVVTALAFMYFLDKGVDYVLLEVGLGGRFDATNVITPKLSIITNIDLDHTEILGDTLEAIAFEKAGIIKEDIPVVIGFMESPAELVILKQAAKKKTKVIEARKITLTEISVSLSGQVFSYGDQVYKLALLGKHQLENVKIVLSAIEALKIQGLEISNNAIKKGLESCFWPGRFEIIKYGAKNIILDVAHNPQSMEILCDNLKGYCQNKRIVFILGVFKDKDIHNILKPVKALNYSIIATRPLGDRGLDSEKLAIIASEQGVEVSNNFDNLNHALDHAMDLDVDIICICGSFNTVGPLREYLKSLNDI